jgi:hypothetical protein
MSVTIVSFKYILHNLLNFLTCSELVMFSPLSENTLAIHYDAVVLNYNYGTRNEPCQFSD